MPVTPVIPTNAPQHAAMRMRDDFKEDKRVYKETITVEKTLLKQLSKAVPEMYLKTFQNKFSNTISKPVSHILQHLFDTYGRVSQEILSEEESKLKAKVFDVSEPLVIMYNEVDELKDLAEAAKNPFSDSQLVNIGLNLIKNTGDYKKGLIEWYEKTTDTDWVHFEKHFETAQDNLRKVRGPTMKSGALQKQANAISQLVMANMQNERNQYLNAVQESKSRIVNAIDNGTPSITDEESSITQEAINSTTATDPVMIEVLKLL